MNMKRVMMIAVMAAILGAGFVPSACAAVERPVPPSVVVESVKFRQRYPWNGLVDIDAKIWCSNPTTNLAVYVAAWDNVKDRALKVKTVWVDGDETKNPDLVTKSGTVRIVWDARADNPNEVSQNVSVSVQAYVRDMRYLVIDLSEGPDATEWPYCFMPDPPNDGWTDEYKTNKLVLRFIPSGTFWMGSPEDEVGRNSNETLHKVTLSQPFYMAIFETTQRQYEMVMKVGDRPSWYKNDEYYATRPLGGQRDWARGVCTAFRWPTLSDVSEESFAGKLRAKTGISTFDLPTEARWEYACRAGTLTALNNGSNILTASVSADQKLNRLGRYNTLRGGDTQDLSRGTMTVGSFMPNVWGLYDMHGNVYEWCLDGVQRDYDRPSSGYPGQYYYKLDAYSSDAVVDPTGKECEYCHGYPFGTWRKDYHAVIRGGCFESPARDCRSASRAAGAQYSAEEDRIGFRICCDVGFEK